MQRTRAIIAAAIAAILTGVGLFYYVNTADQRAQASESPVTILVAKQAVPSGTPFETAYNTGLVQGVPTPKRLVPPTAVKDPQALAGTVAVNPIAAGQLIVSEGFAKPSELATAGASAVGRRIPNGRVAVTFTASSSAAVAGLIQPGDHVNLLIQVPDAKDIGLPTTNGPAVVHVFQNLEVFALGTTASTDPNAGAAATPAAAPAAGGAPAVSGTLYTVLVDPRDSARLILLTTQYPVTLGLVNPTYTPREIPPVKKPEAMPDGLTPDESAGKH
jgi:pilus assembly protein CpaB